MMVLMQLRSTPLYRRVPVFRGLGRHVLVGRGMRRRRRWIAIEHRTGHGHGSHHCDRGVRAFVGAVSVHALAARG
jgi:hypothetical protein